MRKAAPASCKLTSWNLHWIIALAFIIIILELDLTFKIKEQLKSFTNYLHDKTVLDMFKCALLILIKITFTRNFKAIYEIQ